MTITTDTPAVRAAETAKADLAAIQRRRDEYEDLALRGRMNAATVAEVEAEQRLAEMRANAANRAAEKERQALAGSDEIRATLDEFTVTPDLSGEPLREALEQVQEAIVKYRRLVTEQHATLKAWGDKLTALGIPREGFTIDDTPVTVSAGNLMGSTAVGQITIGDATVEAIHRPNRFLVDAINDPTITGTDHRTPIEEVTRIDRRS